MGEVWLGRHVVSSGVGAVKIMRANLRDPAGMRVHLAREGRAVARLRHPHIVGVFEIGDDHLVCQLVEGQDLARRLRAPIEPAAAVHIVLQVASALAHAHARDVVHRDVKPSNILLDRQGSAYLTDFGLAVLLDADDETVSRAGTPAFMAPEQALGLPGPAADQYALARTLLEMLVGGRLSVDAEQALAELPEGLPAELRSLLARATARLPEHRWPSVAAFAVELARVDLAGHAPTTKLAPELRLRAPFAWCARPHHQDAPAPDLMRLDFRLGELGRSGALPAQQIDELLAHSGYVELGWAMYGSTARLGRLDEPSALARASEVVVLLHGWGVARETWRHVAAALCRDNAQVVVLTPDLWGMGEGGFASPRPSKEQLALPSIVDTVLKWLRLLRLGELPTVLVGHSLTGAALLSCTDDDVGANVARVAISPAMPAYSVEDMRYQRQTRAVMTLVYAFGPLRRSAARFLMERAPALRELAPEVRASMLETVLRLPFPTATGMSDAIITAKKFTRQRHRNLMLVVGDNDPTLKPEAVEAAVADLGLNPSQLARLATGGHFPHLESVHPEWTLRNHAEIVHLITSMLQSSEHASSPHAALDSTLSDEAAALLATELMDRFRRS